MADPLLGKLIQAFSAHYSKQRWWPANSPFEVALGAVLTQNTNWKNVEKALAKLGEPKTPRRLISLSTAQLEEGIRPAGFYRQKAATLKRLSAWWLSSDLSQPTPRLREELLSLKGIGKETADSILLYGLNRPILVVDAYSRRICSRLGLRVPKDYDAFRLLLEEALDGQVLSLQAFHGHIVTLAKDHCKKKPLCQACPARDFCQKIM